MRIGLVTYHHARHSYGATLQALATVRALEGLGHDVEIINYMNTYEQAEIKHPSAKAYVNWAARMCLYQGRKDLCRKHKTLDAVYGCVTRRKYTALSQMGELAYDVLMVGSDQVWNPSITAGLDEAFLLRFGQAARRISYASSMGSYKLSDKERERFRQAFEAFAAISVREEHAKEQLQPLTEREIQVVVDPTFLLTRQDWEREFPLLGSRPDYPPYLLTYFIGGNLTDYWEDVRPYWETLGLPIWNIQSHSRMYPNATRALNARTLPEVLSLIDNAALIVTDSFHGTAISISFGKQFVAVPHPMNPARVIYLLKTLGLSDRIKVDPRRAIGDTIAYPGVWERVDAQRAESMAWLRNALDG